MELFTRPDDACTPAAGVVLAQSPTGVIIAAKTENVGVCGVQSPRRVPQFVDLDEPLGDRTLLHAPVLLPAP